MDIHKIIDLFGLGDDDKAEDLESAMERQILPDSDRRETSARTPPDGTVEPAADETDDTAEKVTLITVGRCPTCGDTIHEKATRPCAWCNTPCRPEKDGFHLVHVALGAFQERHSFCSDECFEAFRRMYPARVHRDCYERSCRDCDFCIKRFTDESEGFPGTEQAPRPRPPHGSEKA